MNKTDAAMRDRATEAVNRIQAIRKAADGRELTASQRADHESAVESLKGAMAALGMTRELEWVGDGDPERVAHAAAMAYDSVTRELLLA